ncbi:MAG: FAD-binding protein [Alphaproteobacteria bacterium]|nr:FAD-binding protein [Alphaproteobacteria bacterium]
MAAIAAHDAGARVVLLEKMPDPGGISVCSFGGVRVTDAAADAFAYLARTNGDTAPVDVLRALAAGMAGLPRVLASLARGTGAVLEQRAAPGNYPFAGYRSFGFVNVVSIPGVDPQRVYPQVRGAPGGALMFRLIEMNLVRRGLRPRVSTPVESLVVDRGGRIVGVVARHRRRAAAIRARGGVILACGGFEGDAAMQRQYWPEQPVLNAAFRGNTGDGIRMAQSVGADLWHMWHYHGAYGFRHPDPRYPFGIRTKRLPDWTPGERLRGDVRCPWILVDRFGRRFMNEYEPYLQDTGARPLARYASDVQDFAAIPAWLIADADGHALWPFGRPTWHERGVGYEWSADNEAELRLGLLHRARDLDELARGTGVTRAALERSLGDWNAACAAGADAQWRRPPTSMVPIRRAPFTYAPVWPIVSNTQGGPVHDARQRVLDPAGAPIPGLYAAGECGSLFGHLYMSGGNIAECFVGGRIAGRGAARSAIERRR